MKIFKSNKIVFILIAIIAFLLCLSIKVEATLDLNELKFDAQINEDGSMNVTETWNIYISSTNTLFKTFKMDTTKFSGISEVEVREITKGREKDFSQIYSEMYHVTKDCYYGLINSNGLFEIAWGVGLDNSSDTRKYQISYKVEDVITKYDDYSEIYWQFVGEDFEIDADKITGTIMLPSKAESKEDILVWGHTKYLNGEIYVTDLDKIEFFVNKYSSGNYVEIRSLIPNYIIPSVTKTYNGNIEDEVISEETVWADEANARRAIRDNFQNMIYVAVVAVDIILFLFIIKKLIKMSKLEKKYKPTTKLQYFRELPYEDATPAEALFMQSKGITRTFSQSFSANILDLCLKKYISLEAEKKTGILSEDIVKITLLENSNNDAVNNLKDDEKLTLNFLKDVAKDSNELTTKDINKYLKKHYNKIYTLDDKLEKILLKEEKKKQNYSEEKQKEANKYSGFMALYIFFGIFSIPFIGMASEISTKIIGVSLIFFAELIINGIILGIMASRVNVFSQQGVDEREKWNAFEKYMKDFSLLKDKEVPALVVWEKFLVFATAFGISSKVLKQLKVIYPEITDTNSAMFTTYSYIHLMDTINIGDCINSSVYSAVGSSGSGSGGGFSGGGGGGRWPEVAVADAKNNYFNQDGRSVLG